MLVTVIVGDDVINSLGIARNLGRCGINVFRIGETHSKLLNSRYIKETKIYHDLSRLDDKDFLSLLVQFSKQFKDKLVLFPIDDRHVLKIARLREKLSQYYHFTTWSTSPLSNIVNKRNLYSSLSKMGIPHPKTIFANNLEEIRQEVKKLEFPILVKPEISPVFNQKFKKKAFVATDIRELNHFLTIAGEAGISVMIQELIPGSASQMYGIAGYRYKNKLIHYCYQRVREYPAGLGNGSLLISVKSFLDKTDLKKYFNKVGYYGLFDAEFKFDSRDNIFKLIEINTRSWWQNAHPTICGINLIRIAYEVANNNLEYMESIYEEYRCDAKLINIFDDFGAMKEMNRGFLKWLLSLRGKKTFAIWSLDDPYPGFYWLRCHLMNKARTKK